MVVTCPNHLIDQTLSIARGAGLQPVHLDVGTFALWNTLLTWGSLKKDEEVALIDLGQTKQVFTFSRTEFCNSSAKSPPPGLTLLALS